MEKKGGKKEEGGERVVTFLKDFLSSINLLMYTFLLEVRFPRKRKNSKKQETLFLKRSHQGQTVNTLLDLVYTGIISLECLPN